MTENIQRIRDESPKVGVQSGDVLVQVEQAARIYPMTGGEVHALRGVSLVISRGGLVALKGRSGSGKTTLLNLIGGLDRPTSGRVLFDGLNLADLKDAQRTRLRIERMGFIFQSFALLPTYSAFENVELALRLAGWRVREGRERALQCLQTVGLMNRRDSRPDELSGGQQQRVALARAMATRPDLILADEPTGELDTASTLQVLSLFRRLVDYDRMTIVVATHNPLIDTFTDTVYTLEDGRLYRDKISL